MIGSVDLGKRNNIAGKPAAAAPSCRDQGGFFIGSQFPCLPLSGFVHELDPSVKYSVCGA